MKGKLHKETLKSLLADSLYEMPGISLVYLFGSRLHDNIGPLSDYDLGVLVDRVESGRHIRSRLFHELSRKMETQKIDVVVLNRVPIEFAYAVIAHGELLYQRDDATRVEYEARIMGLYFDYLPVLRSQRHDILQGGEYAARVHRYRATLGRTERTLVQIRASQKQGS